MLPPFRLELSGVYIHDKLVWWSVTDADKGSVWSFGQPCERRRVEGTGPVADAFLVICPLPSRSVGSISRLHWLSKRYCDFCRHKGKSAAFQFKPSAEVLSYDAAPALITGHVTA